MDAVGTEPIAAALESRREELIAKSLAEIQSRLPVYRHVDPALLDDVPAHI